MTNEEISKESKRLRSIFQKAKTKTEEDRIWKELKAVEDACLHPVMDRSVGGGYFCSICDKYLFCD
jgi:hypothetical protein